LTFDIAAVPRSLQSPSVPRPRRAIFAIATLLSLFLLAATLTLWATHRTADLRVRQTCFGLRSAGGRLWIAYGRADALTANDGHPPNWQWHRTDEAPGPWQPLGFETGQVEVDRPAPMLSAIPGLGRLFSVTTTTRFVAIPLLPLAALATLLPIACVLSHLRRRRRITAHLCPDCGYDLRATPDRCPECGSTSRR
jgi:hypothetical protein